MKLKKIASLALAGIMAVSMLAGCGEAASSKPTTPPDTTVTTGVATALNDARTSHMKDILKVSYAESTSLAGLLDTAAKDKFSKDSKAIESLAGDGYASAKQLTGADYDDMYRSICQSLTGNAFSMDDWNSGTALDDKIEGTNRMVALYAVGGDLSVDAAANSVANLASWGTKVWEDNDYLPVSDADNDIGYTAEAAAVKVSSNDHTDASIWVIAVVYTQTVAKV